MPRFFAKVANRAEDIMPPTAQWAQREVESAAANGHVQEIRCGG